MHTTIRDIAIAFGYEVNKQSESKVNESVDKLKSYASKVLGAIAVYFTVRGLSSLAEAAANAEALKSQFSQVFGDMEDQAAKTMKSIADETGVSAVRMKGSFVQIAAFAKTTGMDTENALGLTDRAMRAVADSAAFYDRSLEDVTASLQSFLKGNYANDAALGLSATETTRNTAANALYGKSFKDLAEDQKQLTLLKMVEDANAASGALGQAARESDTWGNQLGNLKQSLADLKVEVGGAFLKPAIQVLKLFSQLVEYATDAVRTLTAEGRLLNRMFDRITNWLKRAQVYIERFVKKVGGAENAFKLLAIAAASIFTAMNSGAILSFIKNLTGLLNPLNLKVLAIAGIIALVLLAVDDFINFMQGNGSLIGVMFEKWGIDADGVRKTIIETWNKIKSALLAAWNWIKTTAVKTMNGLKAFWEKNGYDIMETLLSVWTAIKTVLVTVWNALKTIAVTVFNALKAFWDKWGDTVGNKFQRVFSALLNTFQGLAEFITGVFTGDWSRAWNGIKTVCTGAIDAITGILGKFTPVLVAAGAAVAIWKLPDLLTSGANAATGFLKGVQHIPEAIASVGTKLGKLGKFENIKNLKTAFSNLGNELKFTVQYLGEWVKEGAKTIASLAKQTAAWVADTAAKVANKAALIATTVAQKAVTAAQWLMNAAMSANPIGLLIAAVVALIAIFVALWKNNEGFRRFFIAAWEKIKAAFAAVVDFFRQAWDGIVSTVKGAFATISGYWSDIKGWFSEKLSFAWDWLTSGLGGIVEDAKQIFNGIVDFISGVFTGDWEKAWQGVKDIFRGIVDSLVELVKTPINAIIDLINGAIEGLNKIKIPDWVPGMGGKGINIPLIPKLAKGSDFSPDTFIAGEKGPELITGAKGKKVFTAFETSGIFGAIGDALGRVVNAANAVGEGLETWRPRQRTEEIEADVTVNAPKQQADGLANVVDGIGGVVRDAIQTIVKTDIPKDSGISEAITNIGGMIDNAAGFVADKFSQIREKTDNSGIADVIKSFGSDITLDAPSDNGIVEAVKGIGGMVDNAVKFVADKIPQIKEKADSSGIIDAIRSFGSDISALSKSATANPATVQSMVTSTMNRNVTQTNYFESTFNGERAAQKRMSESAGKNAEDAAGMLARALAYAR